MCHNCKLQKELLFALVAVIIAGATTAQAGDSVFRTQFKNSALGGGSFATTKSVPRNPATQINLNATSNSGGNNHFQIKSTNGARLFKNNFSNKTGVVPAPNGNTGYTGIGLPKSPQQHSVFSSKSNLKTAKVIAAPNGNTGYTGAGLPSRWQDNSVGVFNNQSLLRHSDKIIAAPNGNTGITGGGLPQYRQLNAAPLIGDGKLNSTSSRAKTVRLQPTQGLAGDIGDWIDDTTSDAVRIGSMVPDFVLGTVNDGKDFKLDSTPTAGVTFNKISNESTREKIPVSIQASTRVSPEELVRNVSVNDSAVIGPAAITDRYAFENLKSTATLPAAPNSQTGPGGGQPQPEPPAPTPAPNKLPLPPLPAPAPHSYPSIPIRVTPSTPVYYDQPVADAPTQVGKVSSSDLVLEDLVLESQATLVAGPAYRLTYRNQSFQDVGKFQVAILVGLENRLSENAARAVVEVPGLKAGQSAETILRLPVSAVKSSSGQSPAELTYLYVAVDFQGSISELDESNNVAVVCRADLEIDAPIASK